MNNTYGTISKKNLNFDEEIELSKKIRAGEKAKEILAQGGFLSEEEHDNLIFLITEGDLAFEQLVTANIPRAMKFANETWQKNQRGVNDIEDYRQTALKVICVCARTYDWEKGYRFSTYAHRCLQHEMLRENARTCYALRVPEENLMQYSRLKQEASASGSSGADISRGISNKLMTACSPYISLQSSSDREGSEDEFGEFLPDPEAMTAEQIEDKIVNEGRMQRLIKALEALPEDEKNFLKERMGFFGAPQPMRAFVGTAAKSVSGVQKKQIAAEKHLRELYYSLPLGC